MNSAELTQFSAQNDDESWLRQEIARESADSRLVAAIRSALDELDRAREEIGRRELVTAPARAVTGLPIRHTSRGFDVWAEFPDGYGATCAVRTCGVDNQNGVWVGVEKPRLAYLPLDQARTFRDALDAAISTLEAGVSS